MVSNEQCSCQKSQNLTACRHDSVISGRRRANALSLEIEDFQAYTADYSYLEERTPMNKIKKFFSDKINRINGQPINKLDWAILIVLSVFMFVTMFYADLIIIYNHSLTFLDSLFSFDMANFYANSLAKPYFGFGAVYYWTVYLVIGIWNLPVWILQKLFGINVFSIKCLLWCRLEVVFFLILTLWMMEKLLREFGFGKEKYRFAQFLFASSLLVLLPTVSISQIDIITVFLMLLGIYEYVRTDKITWKFLLIFSFTASLKIFALFVFIPLVLLREKRILYAIWDLLMGTVWIALCLLPYAGREDYIEATSVLNDVMVERMFTTTFPAGNVEIPAFLSILVAISIWAYIKKPQTKESCFYDVNWIGLAVFADFFIFVFAHPYWIVLLAPYLILLVVMNAEHTKINLILEFFLSACVSVFYWCTFGVYVTEDTFSYLILPRFGLVPNGTGYQGLSGLIEAKNWENYVSVLFGIFVVCLLAFLWINRPEKKQEQYRVHLAEDWKNHVSGKLTFDHGMIYLRLLMVLVYIIACVYIAYLN